MRVSSLVLFVVLAAVIGCDAADPLADAVALTEDPSPSALSLSASESDKSSASEPTAPGATAFASASASASPGTLIQTLTGELSRGARKRYSISASDVPSAGLYVEVVARSGDPDLYLYGRTNSGTDRLIRKSIASPPTTDGVNLDRSDLRSSETKAIFEVHAYTATRFELRVYRRAATGGGSSALDLRLPLPGGKDWLLTTEAGGYDACAPNGTPLQSHVGNNHYSLDFSARTRQNNGRPESSVTIYPAASGRVVAAPRSVDQYNGYYVVIDHDGDGDLSTGYSTRYLHLKSAPSVSVGQTVTRSTALGTMGTTGLSTGVHLHFGVRYQNRGESSVRELRDVRMEGRALTSFKTACSGGTASGYYASTNTR